MACAVKRRGWGSAVCFGRSGEMLGAGSPARTMGPKTAGELLAAVTPPPPVISGTTTLSRLRARMQSEQRKVDRSLVGTFHPRRSTPGYTDVSAGRRAFWASIRCDGCHRNWSFSTDTPSRPYDASGHFASHLRLCRSAAHGCQLVVLLVVGCACVVTKKPVFPTC